MRKFRILLFFALIISSTTDAKRISEPDEEIVPIIKTEGEDKNYMYHMNWGWGGTYNGWYLNNGFPYNNNYSREMHQITNVRPNR